MRKRDKILGGVAVVGALVLGVSVGAYASSTSLGSTGGQVVVPGAEFEHVVEEIWNSDVSGEHSIECSTGYIPLTGGWENISSSAIKSISESYPDYTSNSWVVNVIATDTDPSDIRLHAICVDFPE